MPPEYLIGLDAGGHSIRCMVVHAATGKWITAARPWRHTPAPSAGWAFDLDMEGGWQSLLACTREAIEKAQITPDQIAALAITGMRHSMVVLDTTGNPLLATPTQDARAAAQSSELGGQLGDVIYQRTCRWPLPIFSLCRLLWMQEIAQDQLRSPAKVLPLSSWFAWRLCGEFATDPTLAIETLLFDIRQKSWAQDLFKRFSIPDSLFPTVLPAGTRIGSLTPDAATSSGLRPGLPIVLAGGDTQCGLLGLSAISPNQVAAITGTTAPVQVITSKLTVDRRQVLWSGLHLIPDQFLLESNAGSLGESLDWIAELFYPDDKNPQSRFIAEASLASAGSAGLISTFGAQVFNAKSAGAPVGSITLNPYIGGQSTDRKANLARSILEGMAYGLRANIEQLATLTQYPEQLLLGGGMARSSFWAQLVSDVLGIPVAVPSPVETSAYGAALCAGVGAGIFHDLSEGARTLNLPQKIYHPDERSAKTYQQLYPSWEQVRQNREKSDDLISSMMVGEMMSELEVQSTHRAVDFRPRILVTAQMDDYILSELRQIGEVTYASYRESLHLLTADDLVEALQNIDIFITEMDMVDHESLQRLPDLRLIVSCRGNAVNIDVDACTVEGIPVLNTPGRNADAVAELTILFILMLAHKLPQAQNFLHKPGGEAGDMGRMGQAHEEFLGNELWHKTIGLVGLGAVGSNVVRRVSPFHARILVYDPYADEYQAQRLGVELTTLENLLAESDFISLHAPVTDETRGMLGVHQFDMMKPGSFLINTARAALVDDQALLEALQSGKIAGAAIDVFSSEPPGWDDPLLQQPNLIATPHIGGNTAEVAAHQGQIILADLKKIMRGEQPQHILNPQTLAAFSWKTQRKISVTDRQQAAGSRSFPSVTDITPQSETMTLKSDSLPAPTPQHPPTPNVTQEMTMIVESSSENQLRSQMEKILHDFLDAAAHDPTLLSFAEKKHVISQYTISDLDLVFHIGFMSGEVITGLGAAPRPAEVKMKASAETFDGIFTGRINGNKAAMGGKLSFSGDVRLAMGMQRVQGDLIRLYTAARTHVQDLDFNASPTTAQIKQAALPVESGDLRQQLVKTIQELYETQLITATGGNLSARIPEKLEAWITPGQIFKGDLRPESMVRIDFEGNSLDPDAFAPSSERLVHTEIYKRRQDVQAIVHAHAPYTTILGLSGLPFLPVTTDAAYFKELPVVPFIMPGTRELAIEVAKRLGNNPAVIMQNHGVVVAGSSLRRASNFLEAIERTSQLMLGCYAVGKKPPTLPKDMVKLLQEVGEMMA